MTNGVSLGGVLRLHAGLVFVLAAIAWGVGLRSARTILAGGALIALGMVLNTLVGRLLQSGQRPNLAIGLYFAKLAALFGIGWLVVREWGGGLDPLGFGVGIACLPLAAAVAAIRSHGR